MRAKILNWSKEYPRGALRALSKAAMIVVGDIQANRLRGQVLNVRSGRLIGSITHEAKLTPTGAVAKVGTNVWYGRMWELGEGVPAREFIRPSIKAKQSRVREIILAEIMAIYNSVSTGTVGATAGLTSSGSAAFGKYWSSWTK